MLGAREVDELASSLGRRFRVAETRVQIGDRVFAMRHPANAEELISEEDFERDERLPYWADIWPSSRVLAARLLAENGAGRSLVELGCGAGLVSSAAAVAGFDVVATDYYEDALRFTRLNAHRNSGRDIATRLLDWRDMASDLGRFDVVAASDVLYERAYGPLVAGALDRLLANDGIALLADPGRVGRDEFLHALERLRLVVAQRGDVAYEDCAIRQTIALIQIRRAMTGAIQKPADRSAP